MALRSSCRAAWLRASSTPARTFFRHEGAAKVHVRFASITTGPASSPVDGDMNELEPASSFAASADTASRFDPIAQSRGRTQQLPASRYKLRPPKYYRGPLHPHQPLRRSDPSSREFIPGPFSSPRLSQTYTSTVAPDLMAIVYQHFPPGYAAPPKTSRLRSWDDSSPYHKGRPLRAPRGGDVLSLIRKPVMWRNIPRLESVVVHSFVKDATENSAYLHVAGMAIQAITGVKCTPRQARHNVSNWQLRQGKYVAVTAELNGEHMYNFVGSLVDVAMPRFREWRGVNATSGDSSGNITLGLSPEEVACFPEIEVNYDAYPPRLIPGCHITMKTTARDDRDAKLLLTALGIPFA